MYLYNGGVAVSLVGLCYGAEVAYRLTIAWINRFGCLRRVFLQDNSLQDQKEDDEYLNTEKIMKLKSTSIINSLIFSEIVPHLTRDGNENYLFLVEYMNQASIVWSPVITGLSLSWIFLLAYLFAMKEKISPAFFLQASIAFFVNFFIFTVYPIVAMAHANSFTKHLHMLFVQASPDDFQVIGGKEKWKEFISSVPAVWTIFGLEITWQRLFAVFSTLLTIMFAFGLTFL
jgi:hypothetical protein